MVGGCSLFHTLGALAERVSLHAEGSAEAFPVTEAGRFGLLGGTLLDGLGVTCELLARPNRRPRIGEANTLEDAQFLAEMGENKMNAGWTVMKSCDLQSYTK